MSRQTPFVFLLSFLPALFPVTRLQAAAYTLTDIADTTGSHGFFGPSPDVNSSGTVVFTAAPRNGGAVAVYTGNGGALTQVANESGIFSGFGTVAINDSGTVAFNASLDAGGSGIYARPVGQSVITIADTSGPLSNPEDMAINSAGVVAFTSELDAGGAGVFAGNGGALTTVAESPAYGSFETRPGINSAGTVAFIATPAGASRGVFTSDGSTVTTISQHSVAADNPTINSSGMVAYRGSSAIDESNGGAVTTIADTSGPYSAFQSITTTNDFESPGVSDDGRVVFGALLDSGGSGLFYGPDPVNDRIIETGDPLFGSTLSAVAFFGGVSGNGNVAFVFFLSNGVSGVAEATPVPVPEVASLPIAGLSMMLLGSRRRVRRS